MSLEAPLLKKRYRLGRLLGAGGQGRTYIAYDTAHSDQEVVVKQLTLGEGASWKKFDLYEREVKVLQELSHHGIPSFVDHFESEPPGSFYIVMSRAPGRTLKEIGRFDEPGLRSIMIRTLGILAYLHSRKPPVIHRDVKPANLLRTEDGAVSLVDFGGVRAALREGGGSTVVGTFGYMAPEQLHGEATSATDVFGLGATIVALAGGIEPEKVPRRGLRMDLRKHLPGLSRPLIDLLERMTEPDPDKRPRSAKDVLRLLTPATVAAPGAGTASPNQSTSTSEIATVDKSESEELLHLDLPEPARTMIGILLTIVGFAGGFSLWIIHRALLPILFTVVSAFVGTNGRTKLRSFRNGSDKALTGARSGFRRLRSAHKKRPPKQLPPASSKTTQP